MSNYSGDAALRCDHWERGNVVCLLRVRVGVGVVPHLVLHFGISLPSSTFLS